MESPPYIKFGKMRSSTRSQMDDWFIRKGNQWTLTDEMDLGKTLQSTSILGYLKHYQKFEVKITKLFLIVPL